MILVHYPSISLEVNDHERLSDFMKNEKNRVPGSAQNTEDVEGYFYERPGGGQR